MVGKLKKREVTEILPEQTSICPFAIPFRCLSNHQLISIVRFNWTKQIYFPRNQ